jgi:metal-responsive CopG/Arc/MetJ family transcriptional regulator
METPKLYIPAKKYTGESTVVSTRLPKDMVAEMDRIAKETGRNRSEVMSLCLEFALEHMVRPEQSETEEE